MTTNTPTLRYTILLIQDPVDKGYTAFFAEFPNIIVEGDNKEEARNKLFAVAGNVFDFKRKNTFRSQDLFENSDYRVSVEPYNAELAPA